MPETKKVEQAEKVEQVEQVVAPKRKPVKKFFKSFVDVKRWSSYDEVSSNTKTTWGLFKRLLYKGSGLARQETYEEAVIRLGLSDEQLVVRKKNFLYSALVYMAFAVGFFIYFVYLLINHNILAAVLMLVLVTVMLLATYREHFWYMQMQKKKLGCNFNEWLAYILRRSI